MAVGPDAGLEARRPARRAAPALGSPLSPCSAWRLVTLLMTGRALGAGGIRARARHLALHGDRDRPQRAAASLRASRWRTPRAARPASAALHLGHDAGPWRDGGDRRRHRRHLGAGAPSASRPCDRGRPSTIAGYVLRLEGIETSPGRTTPPSRGDLRSPAMARRSPRSSRSSASSPSRTISRPKTAIWTDLLTNVYVAIDNPDRQRQLHRARLLSSAGALHLARRGAVWRWAACLSLTDRRHRVGAPTRRTRPAPAGGIAQAAD